jgi:hypothetical protein
MDLVAMAPARPPAMPLTGIRPNPPTTSPSVPAAPSPVVSGQIPVSRVVAPATTGGTAAAPPPSTTDTGTDLDELARRLFEPVSRLLRADLRQGRERAGRGHDRRR